MSKRLSVTLLASLGLASSASAANLLGTTMPFSKTALCQRVGCTVIGNAQVGGYLFATYAAKDSYGVGSSGYFSFLKNGKTIAVGVYALGSQDSTMAGSPQDLKDLVGLTDRPMPNLNGAMGSASTYISSSSEQVLRRDRNVTLPLGNGMVLTNKSQRIALGNDAAKFGSQRTALRFIDVAYVALASEVDPISRLINRWAPLEQSVAQKTYVQSLKLRSGCPATLANGTVLGISKFVPGTQWASWAVARGYTLNHNTFSLALALPGLALSSIEVNTLGTGSMEAAARGAACIR